MRFGMSRTFPAPRRSGFNYLTDLTTWEEWSPIAIPEAEGVRFDSETDSVLYRYRPVGVPVKGQMRLLEAKDGEFWKLRFEQKAFADVDMTWRFENAGAHAFTLTVLVEIEDPKWWDRTYQWISMIPWAIKRDVLRSMDDLHRHFTHLHEIRTAS